jgi:SCO1/SenC
MRLDHPFVLADADGKTVTSADFPGKWLLIYFGYTHCSDQCPTALSAMAEALDESGRRPPTYSRSLLPSILSVTTALCCAISPPLSINGLSG